MAQIKDNMELKSFRFAGQRDSTGTRKYKPGAQVTQAGGDFSSRRVASIAQKGQSVFIVEYQNGQVDYFINCPIIATYGPVVEEPRAEEQAAETPDPATAPAGA